MHELCRGVLAVADRNEELRELRPRLLLGRWVKRVYAVCGRHLSLDSRRHEVREVRSGPPCTRSWVDRVLGVWRRDSPGRSRCVQLRGLHARPLVVVFRCGVTVGVLELHCWVVFVAWRCRLLGVQGRAVLIAGVGVM